jgi:hypothetical protein
MANKDVDWASEEEEGLAEQYAKLVPYILRDFAHRDDIKNMILALQADPTGLVSQILSDSEGIRAAQGYKSILDSGESLTDRIKPVIKL